MQHAEVYSKVEKMAEQAGLSVAALCKRAEVSPATVTHWKNGTAMPSMRVWAKLEKAAGEATASQ